MEGILQKSGFSIDNVTDEQYQQGVCDRESVEEVNEDSLFGTESEGHGDKESFIIN